MQGVGLNSAETKKNGHGGMEIINGRQHSEMDYRGIELDRLYRCVTDVLPFIFVCLFNKFMYKFKTWKHILALVS